MTLNCHFALKSVSGLATDGLASPAFGESLFENLQIDKNVIQGTHSFWQYKVYADIRGGSLGRGRQMRVWSSKMASFASSVHCLPNVTAFTWCDCRWSWRYFKVIRLLHINFLKNVAWYGKSYYRLLIGSHALAFDWCHFWWPWMIFEGHFTLPSPMSGKLYRIRTQKL